MLIQRVVMVAAFAAQAVLAQSHAQLVQEVEKEAYSATTGICNLIWGPSQIASQGCTALTAPADKILAVRQASVHCSGRSGDRFAQASLVVGASANGYGNTVSIPLEPAAPFIAAHQAGRVGLVPVFLNAGPNAPVRFSARFDGQKAPTNPAYCSLTFQGFYLPANP